MDSQGSSLRNFLQHHKFTLNWNRLSTFLFISEKCTLKQRRKEAPLLCGAAVWGFVALWVRKENPKHELSRNEHLFEGGSHNLSSYCRL